MFTKPNELGLLTDEAYQKTHEDCGDGTNFLDIGSHEELARALVTCLWEQGFLNAAEIKGGDSRLLDLMLIVKGALSEGGHIDVKERLGPLQESLRKVADEILTTLDE
ncbi:hypothetical protein [Pseudomonas sp. 2FE]|uniref:hypothetical protein n=1 Tax=Pseudomonas sp. 2FE TaxID=2502190 RepID=UPI0010F833FC|nr:hypothetical protein [Pseudomonas sp. 2FE]